MAKSAIKVGATVRVRGLDGPVMTVAQNGQYGSVRCIWFVQGEVGCYEERYLWLEPEALDLVKVEA